MSGQCGQRKQYERLVALLALVALAVSDAGAAVRSNLSRWLSGAAVEEIAQYSTYHPRLQRATLGVVSLGGTELDRAIVTVMRESLARQEGITVVSAADDFPGAAQLPESVDDLDCQSRSVHDYELRVRVSELQGRQAEVLLDLRDVEEPESAVRAWRWRGSLTAAERDYFSRAAGPGESDGSLASPWTDADTERAARALSRQLVCSFRPQISGQLRFGWPDLPTIAPTLQRTLLETRRQLGNYHELVAVDTNADYELRVQQEPLGEDLWQVWVSATPLRKGLSEVQAVTYLKYPRVIPVVSAPRVTSPSVLVAEPGDLEPASRFLEVEMLEANQRDRRLTGADLQVRLRLVNRASRPLEYALAVSGGHYTQCVPEPGYYRHDRYGYIEGRLDAGQSLTRTITIEGAQHNPNPWFGPRKCAGFKGLEGFKHFASQGHRVTQFIRWSM